MNKKWLRAQKSETASWIDTDMNTKKLKSIWQSRLNDFKTILNNLKATSSVIDVGSGPVTVLSVFPKIKRMVAVDSLNNVYKTKYRQTPYIQYLDLQAEKINYKNSTFDAALCINALDHMENYVKALKKMMSLIKKNGYLYLEYENTSPLSVLAAKMGYKKPLDDFHPLLLENRNVLHILERGGFNLVHFSAAPQLSWKKIIGIFQIVTGKKKFTTYEKKISVLNYGTGRALLHYVIISIEAFLFLMFPKHFAYFTKITAQKTR